MADERVRDLLPGTDGREMGDGKSSRAPHGKMRWGDMMKDEWDGWQDNRGGVVRWGQSRPGGPVFNGFLKSHNKKGAEGGGY